MAEACGYCHRSFLPSRQINESLKCACQRPFFSQIVSHNNLPTDQDCWIKVPTRFVRHYSSQFGKCVSLEGDDGQSFSCSLVGSDIGRVGYGFEWHDFARIHNVALGDQVVLTLMEKSNFLIQVYRAETQTASPAVSIAGTVEKIQTTLPVAVKVEPDVDVQVAVAQDWLLGKEINEKVIGDLSSASDPGLKCSADGQSLQDKVHIEDLEKTNSEKIDTTGLETQTEDGPLQHSEMEKEAEVQVEELEKKDAKRKNKEVQKTKAKDWMPQYASYDRGRSRPRPDRDERSQSRQHHRGARSPRHRRAHWDSSRERSSRRRYQDSRGDERSRGREHYRASRSPRHRRAHRDSSRERSSRRRYRDSRGDSIRNTSPVTGYRGHFHRKLKEERESRHRHRRYQRDNREYRLKERHRLRSVSSSLSIDCTEAMALCTGAIPVRKALCHCTLCKGIVQQDRDTFFKHKAYHGSYVPPPPPPVPPRQSRENSVRLVVRRVIASFVRPDAVRISLEIVDRVFGVGSDSHLHSVLGVSIPTRPRFGIRRRSRRTHSTIDPTYDHMSLPLREST